MSTLPPPQDLIVRPLPEQQALARAHFAFVEAERMHALLNATGTLTDWPAFAASWARLELDQHMADGGRYRRRRHAVFHLHGAEAPVRQPHQPHYQSLDYNPLNGGVKRWFSPIEDAIAHGDTLDTVLRFGATVFARDDEADTRWKVEVHQFRIEAHPEQAGLPTPEGMHRDGVDHVLVLMVCRHNIASGTTRIHALDGRELGSFTLTRPFDTALVDDHEVYHGVTAVQPLDAALPAYRDVLVVTYRREGGAT
ncbi:hypothetical protein E4T66_20835 [Sinimarinibacterium sp. CAU 1509]|uniref:2OG-Fe dioxygenase family protein n=1 Tax=Sinimarinibacterium sp. CAU 1509 TaxID=2562283 RepID=UPI0010AC9021|nr:2OG-Fe dioxygenase family protein [Sinimarinibacterium sp. CAU 1509]TJY55558.1 hypothetical protein E4T66_20835 [Sinimarinibacterium sp. CAU 1509]